MTPLSAYPLKLAFVVERSVLRHKVAFAAGRSVERSVYRAMRKVALVAERSVLSHAI